jgi:hypothetical protein
MRVLATLTRDGFTMLEDGSDIWPRFASSAQAVWLASSVRSSSTSRAYQDLESAILVPVCALCPPKIWKSVPACWYTSLGENGDDVIPFSSYA